MAFSICLMSGVPTLTWGDPTLPSALRRFTSDSAWGQVRDHRAKAARQIPFTSCRTLTPCIVQLILQSRTGDLTYQGALYQLEHQHIKFDARQFPTHMGRPHTTIGATAFHSEFGMGSGTTALAA